ncbi:hypothetical protein Clacol_007728 [Clathrus columnatus]|uniref:Uncharacterized protein n=1 Tax=Clathrus columnatus TaxID=1419009 RepID=A0AAV5AK31_9AGAM|nr:hypothetical protein Clacol_007728 [Clathrus columnatus]
MYENNKQAYGHVIKQPRATVCNGHAEFCTRSYGNVLAANQEINVTAQLELGVRLLQAQSHLFSRAVLIYILLPEKMGYYISATLLLFDGGTVQDYLTNVKSFLVDNPTEVVTLLFTNPDGVNVTVWDSVFKAAGVDQLAFIPESVPVKQSDWPTLGDLIDDGKQIVVFMDSDADPDLVPYILPEFEMIWETPFDSTDSSFPCSVNRTAGPLAQTDHMNCLNHFLDIDILSVLIPDKLQAATTNGMTSVLDDAAGCAPLNGGRNPNFILADWVDIGQLIQTAALLNNVAS